MTFRVTNLRVFKILDDKIAFDDLAGFVILLKCGYYLCLIVTVS